MKEETYLKMGVDSGKSYKEGWNTTISRGGSTGEKGKFFCEKHISLQTDFSEHFLSKARLQKQRKPEIEWRITRQNRNEESKYIYETIIS